MEKNRNVSELAHHGIRGQRWGRRRFQNQDGSLTPAGRKRYGGGYLSDSSHKLNEEFYAGPKIKSSRFNNKSTTTDTDNNYIDGDYREVNTRYESLTPADKLRYLRKQGYDLPRTSPRLKSDTTDNDENTDNTVVNNSPKIKSATFNRPNDNDQSGTNNSPKIKSATFNRPNNDRSDTNNSNQTNASNGKKRLKDMTTEELRADNMHYAALNQYKKNHGIKSQGEIRKDISDQAGKAVSSVKDIGNSISKIRSLDKPGPDYSHLSNAELQERINRINLEQRYADLTRPRESSKAVKFKETMNVIGGVVAFTGSVIGVANAIKDLRSSS